MKIQHQKKDSIHILHFLESVRDIQVNSNQAIIQIDKRSEFSSNKDIRLIFMSYEYFKVLQHSVGIHLHHVKQKKGWRELYLQVTSRIRLAIMDTLKMSSHGPKEKSQILKVDQS